MNSIPPYKVEIHFDRPIIIEDAVQISVPIIVNTQFEGMRVYVRKLICRGKGLVDPEIIQKLFFDQ